ncbi:MAG: hypothetical protein CMH54_05355 [Myxococcales bacterium]|nr:hypothetical protein [Myxococcales bacterium]
MKFKRSPDRIGSLFLIGLLFFGAACSSKGDGERRTETVNNSAVEAKLKTAWRDAKTAVQSLEVMARNADSYTKLLEKHRRNFQAIGIFVAIPLEPKIPALQDTLTKYGQTLGLQLDHFSSTPDDTMGTPLPAEFDGPGPFQFSDDQLVGEVPISFHLKPLNLDKVELFCRGLHEHVERLILLREVKMTANGAEVNASVFFFQDIRAPIEKLLLPNREQIFDHVGLPNSGPDCEGSKTCSELIGKIETILKDASAYEAKAQQALSYLSQAGLWEARAAAFEQRQQRVHTVQYSQILR